MFRHGKRGIALLCSLLCTLLCLGGPTATLAAQPRATATVRVGFPILSGFSEKTAEGEYTGYTYEYLQEIAKYTGWEYEFVEVEGDTNASLTALLDMLEAGEIDLMGGMIRNEQTEALYDFPEYSAGTSFAVLTVRADDTRFSESDYSALSNIRVGAQATAKRRIQHFESFCAANNIDAQVETYQGEALWLEALDSGEVDALLEGDTSVDSDRRIIARFAESPHYFATTKGNTAVISGLNTGLAKIREVDFHYDTQLYEKYFGGKEDPTLFLSQEERDYISSSGTLRAVYPAGWNPLHHREKGAFAGVSATLLEQICRETGLSLDYREVGSYQEGVEMIQAGEADILIGAPPSAEAAIDSGLTLTQSYLPLQCILVRSSATDPSRENRAACLRGYPASDELAEQEIIWYDTPEACLQAVEQGEVGSFVTNSYLLQQYLQNRSYRNLVYSPLDDSTAGLCLALGRPADTTLLTVLSKAIGSISERERQDAVFQNTLTTQPKISLMGLLYAYPLQSVLAVVALFAVVLGLVIFFVRTKIRHQQRLVLDGQRYRTIAELSDELLYEYDVQADTLTVSDKFAKAFGSDLIIPHYQARAKELFPNLSGWNEQVSKQVFDLNQKSVQAEICCTLADGSSAWFSMLRVCLYDDEGRPLYCIGKLRNIEKERAERASLLHRSQTDGLTGLYNRRTCEKEVLRLLNALQPGETAAFFLLDLDRFKSVNDRFGHQMGDDILIELARCMETAFPDGVLGRLGGDEFIACLPRCSAPQAAQVAENFCRQLVEHCADRRAGISASVGIAIARSDDTFEALYHRSDKALYQAKAEGGNTFSLGN